MGKYEHQTIPYRLKNHFNTLNNQPLMNIVYLISLISTPIVNQRNINGYLAFISDKSLGGANTKHMIFRDSIIA